MLLGINVLKGLARILLSPYSDLLWPLISVRCLGACLSPLHGLDIKESMLDKLEGMQPLVPRRLLRIAIYLISTIADSKQMTKLQFGTLISCEMHQWILGWNQGFQFQYQPKIMTF